MDEEEAIPSPRIIDDDEVIADSEEEGDRNGAGRGEYDSFMDMDGGAFFPEPAAQNKSAAAPLERTSSVSAFTDTTGMGYPAPPPAQGMPFSAISTFTTTTTTSAKKEKGKKLAADTSIDSVSASGNATDFDQISSMLSTNIADRAKMRQRTQTKKVVEDVIELTSDDDDELKLKPAKPKATAKDKQVEKAAEGQREKPRPRPKPKPKPKVKNPPEQPKDLEPMTMQPPHGVGVEVPTASTSDLPPALKPRPRPRPRKRAKTPEAENTISAPPSKAADFILPSSPPHGPEIPIATFPMIPSSTALSTHLVATDPAGPSVQGSYNAYTNNTIAVHLPRIETLSNPLTEDKQAPPSSPNSLFSEGAESFTTHIRKRKRPSHPNPYAEGGDEEDEMDQLIPSSNTMRKLPPPPTFFAGSSSSSFSGGLGRNDLPGVNAVPPPADQEHDIVDLTMLPPTMPPAAKPTKSAATTVKKKKKTKPVHDDAAFDDTFDSAPLVILDEDDADDDFDPSGAGKKGKAKAKSAKSAKEKKQKEKKEKAPKKDKGKGKEVPKDVSLNEDDFTAAAATGVTPDIDIPAIATESTTKSTNTPPGPPAPRAQVEVVITSKPPSTKKKGKSQSKAKAKDKDQGKEKDKEVFKSREFIEESDDELGMGFPGAPTFGGGIREVPETPTIPRPKPAPGQTEPLAGSAAPAAASFPRSTETDDVPTKRRASGVKRKAIIDSDEDEEENVDLVGKESNAGEEGQDMDEVVIASSKSKKRKTHGQEEDEPAEKAPFLSLSSSSLSKSKSKAKGKGKAKQVILSDDEDEYPGGGDEVHVEEEDVPEVSAKKAKGKGKQKETTSKTRGSKSTSRKVVHDEEEDGEAQNDDAGNNLEEEEEEAQHKKPTPEDTRISAKENINMTPAPAASKPTYATPNPLYTTPAPRPASTTAAGSLNRRSSTPIYANYTIAPRKSGRPMSELIRHVNSLPGSPFPSPHPTSASAGSKLKPLLFRTHTSTAYNPMLKSQRSLLSKIAPLHPNRRTPPPPPPPPPPRKKSKKELEMEEKWEEEMIEDAGGVDAWAAMGDDERKEMRRMKWARELNGWDD
ncbi:hypothetical protein D9613_007961 [Agrocybe pediades]|uniref:Uncharacterized protein n=1 Tax=Agrocybe pediades TaxID=84607 RepID=A0A8H4QMZ9_9AGAR|nr:hypothetical protein D9613_007961 [Agrocybe pediades]